MCNKKCCSGGCCGSWIAKVLLIIGGLNWGLVGLGGFFGGNWNVVSVLLGSWPYVEWAVYILVGISALIMLIGCKCKKCSGCDCGNCNSCNSDKKELAK